MAEPGHWTFAEVLEAVAATVPERPALVHGGTTTTWGQFDRRATNLAAALLAAGLDPGDRVGFYLLNGPEYCELFLACAKARLVHVNTNYRYGGTEIDQLWSDAGVAAVVFDASFTALVDEVRPHHPGVRAWLRVGGARSECPSWAVPYEVAAVEVTAAIPAGVRDGRSPDDLVLMYTGGTTGLPKGVMWRQGDVIAALDRTNRVPLPVDPDPAAVAARAAAGGPTSLPACPLMHATALFNSFNTLALGGTIVTLRGPGFAPAAMLDTIQGEQVGSIFVVGDPFMRPTLRALDAEPDRWDLSSLRVVVSSGAMWSAECKQGLLHHNPDLILVDAYGASEAIGAAASLTTRDDAGSTAAFRLGRDSVVIDDDGALVQAGSGMIGRVAVRGHTPVGYWGDSERSARTFPVLDGVRYSVPGDFATVEADGTIRLLGRGSVCINTGGEKVFPEEVEEALKVHPDVEDAVVVGVPDERFGQAVAAAVSPVPDARIDPHDVVAFVKHQLAGYKAPRSLLVVDRLERAANGKADYRAWAERVAEQGVPVP